MPVDVEEPQGARAGRGVVAGQRQLSSAALPAAASPASLRRIVLTSGARSRPSTRPSAAGGDRVAPSARASRSSAMNTPATSITSSP